MADLRSGGVGGPPAPGDRRLALAILVVTVALVLLTVLMAVHTHWLLSIDNRVTRASVAAARAHPALLDAARLTTQLGNPIVVDVVIAAIAGAVAVRGRWHLAAAMVLTRVVGLAAETMLKVGVARARPHMLHPLAHAAGASFPSGHSAGAATLVTLVILMSVAHPGADGDLVGPAMIKSERTRLVIGFIAMFLAAAVAASRVLLGVHYLTDVIAGTLLGVASVLGGYLATITGWRSRRSAAA